MVWFKDGDCNSSLFHAMVKRYANSIGIQRLIDEDFVFEDPNILFLFIKLYMILLILIMCLQILRNL